MNDHPNNGQKGPNGLILAWMWHWHLLTLSALGAFAMLSGRFGMWIPFILAGEVAYLGFLGMNPRFQNILKGKSTLKKKPSTVTPSSESQSQLVQMIAFLSPENRSRFEHLRHRCFELIELRRKMEGSETQTVDSFRSTSLDRMLWLFLKLLHHQTGLIKFLSTAKEDDMLEELNNARRDLDSAEIKNREKGLADSRLTVSIKERIQTIEERIENLHKANESLELVQSEIDKTEQQITHLCEVGMTVRDATSLGSQIDAISNSIRSSEQIFSQADLNDYLSEDQVPSMLGSHPSAAQAETN